MACCASTLNFNFKEPKANVPVIAAISHPERLSNGTILSDHRIFAHLSALSGIGVSTKILLSHNISTEEANNLSRNMSH